MTTQQERQAQMHAKLGEGLEILAQASNEDGYQLGMALLKLHAALEDQFRLEIASKAPSLRMEVEDPKKTTWNELIRYGKQYLRLSESEARVIVEANRQRQSVAHGGNYERSRVELVKYADFVERWCDPGKHSLYELRPRTVPAAPRPYQPPPLPSSGMRNSSRKPWHQSMLFLTLVFFLVPPLWCFSILTGRSRGCLLKLVAGAWLALQVLVAVVVLDPASGLVRSSLQWIDERWTLPIPTWINATAAPEDSPSPVGTPVSNEVTSAASTEASCTLVWAEYPFAELTGKNRSMVWEEIVKVRVDGSGMTARQFYDRVLEHNPDLVRDGYEFRQGKTYLLPACE